MFSVCCHPEILPPWQNDIYNFSSLYTCTVLLDRTFFEPWYMYCENSLLCYISGFGCVISPSQCPWVRYFSFQCLFLAMRSWLCIPTVTISSGSMVLLFMVSKVTGLCSIKENGLLENVISSSRPNSQYPPPLHETWAEKPYTLTGLVLMG